MNNIDFEDRWIYIGCSTLPPCGKVVYWNLLRIVYPFEVKYMSQIKMQFKQQKDIIKSDMNARYLMKPNGNQIYYIGAITKSCSVVVLVGSLLSSFLG